MNLNKVFILGRLTGDPQLRTTPAGQSVATFSIATNRVYNDKMGAKKEEVEYHNIVLWGRQAEVASKFLTKGAIALIEGRIQTRSYTDKAGVQKKAVEIIGESIQLGPRPYGQGQAAPAGGQQWGAKQNASAGSAPSSSHGAHPKQEPAQEIPEEIPVISMDEDDIKAEDLPF